MPEDAVAEVEETEEDNEYKAWLADLTDENETEAVADEAEDEAEAEEMKALKVAIGVSKKLDQRIEEERIEKLVDKFEAGASDAAKELFAIYRKADMTEKEVKGLIQLVSTKAQEAQKGPDPEAVQKAADEVAKQQYGAGPIRQGQTPSAEEELVAEFDRLKEKARKGDTHAAFLLFNGLSGNGEPTTE